MIVWFEWISTQLLLLLLLFFKVNVFFFFIFFYFDMKQISGICLSSDFMAVDFVTKTKKKKKLIEYRKMNWASFWWTHHLYFLLSIWFCFLNEMKWNESNPFSQSWFCLSISRVIKLCAKYKNVNRFAGKKKYFKKSIHQIDFHLAK